MTTYLSFSTRLAKRAGAIIRKNFTTGMKKNEKLVKMTRMH